MSSKLLKEAHRAAPSAQNDSELGAGKPMVAPTMPCSLSSGKAKHRPQSYRARKNEVPVQGNADSHCLQPSRQQPGFHRHCRLTTQNLIQKNCWATSCSHNFRKQSTDKSGSHALRFCYLSHRWNTSDDCESITQNLSWSAAPLSGDSELDAVRLCSPPQHASASILRMNI